MRNIGRLEEDTEEDTCVDFRLGISATGSAQYPSTTVPCSLKAINAALLRNVNEQFRGV